VRDDLGDRVRCGRLRRRKPDARGDQLAGADVDEGGLDAGASDVDAEGRL
jgi:hypothetical protein